MEAIAIIAYPNQIRNSMFDIYLTELLSFLGPVLYKNPIDKYIQYNYNISMEMIRFEWDENKAKINQSKHGISFEEAQTVFYDEEALVIDDPEHSEEEDRFIILGLSKKANLLVVASTPRRSISATSGKACRASDSSWA